MIKEKALKGKSAYAIGAELGISKNTAKKYMEQPVRPHGLKGKKKGSKLDPYKPLLNQWLQEGIFNCVVLMERLREVGYDGGMSILKEYVHPYRPAKSAPAVRRYETPSGKQAQMDWGLCQYLDQENKLHKVAVFVMILGHSRAKYIEFVKRCDLKSLERCMLNGFRHFGGIPKEVLTDNMKTVVEGRETGKVLWNTQFADFAAEMGLGPKVCWVRRPQTKGKVERLVGYVRENFFPGRSFSDLGDFDFSFQPSIDRRQMEELSTLAFVGRAENVILLGPPGVGKTHLAVGLALKALDAGKVVYYTTLSRLISDLKKAQLQGRLERRWKVYLRPSLLVIDEVGYMQLNRQEAELLFRLVSERYEHGSVILTSNKYFSDWGELLSDDILATALLDRLLHIARQLCCQCPGSDVLDPADQNMYGVQRAQRRISGGNSATDLFARPEPFGICAPQWGPP